MTKPTPTPTPTGNEQAGAKPVRLTAVQRAKLALEKAERKAAESAKRKQDQRCDREEFKERVTAAVAAFRAKNWETCGKMLAAAGMTFATARARDDEAGQ